MKIHPALPQFGNVPVVMATLAAGALGNGVAFFPLSRLNATSEIGFNGITWTLVTGQEAAQTWSPGGVFWQ